MESRYSINLDIYDRSQPLSENEKNILAKVVEKDMAIKDEVKTLEALI